MSNHDTDDSAELLPDFSYIYSIAALICFHLHEIKIAPLANQCLNYLYDDTFEQVAERQGKYLVELFDKIGKQNGGSAFSAKDITWGDPFVYKHLGSMASVGHYKALVDLRQSKVTRMFLFLIFLVHTSECFWGTKFFEILSQ